MKKYGFIVVALLLGISAYSIFKYVTVVKEKQNLLGTLEEIKVQLSGLENEKQNLLKTLEKEKENQHKLSQENSGLKNDLKAAGDKLTKLNTDLANTQSAAEELKSQLVFLKEDKEKVSLELAQVAGEKEDLKARLNSIAELKKAIRELKIQTRNAKRLRVKAGKKRNTAVLSDGNRGYVIQDGKPTYPSRIKIEVKPILFPENQ